MCKGSAQTGLLFHNPGSAYQEDRLSWKRVTILAYNFLGVQVIIRWEFGIEGNDLDKKIVQNIASLASIFSTKVCVEGIETEGMRDILKNNNVKRFQGYYYARPLPQEEFLEWQKTYDR